jgi:hypothetical protein
MQMWLAAAGHAKVASIGRKRARYLYVDSEVEIPFLAAPVIGLFALFYRFAVWLFFPVSPVSGWFLY